MAYEKTIWKNREVERPRTFTKVENPDGTITLTPAEGNIIEQGTPIIAANMNNIEDGIEEALDLAQQAFQSASDGKVLVAGAITGKGVSTDPSDTFQQMATNIGAIETGVDTNDATAIAADILVNKTAYVKGEKLTGTIPNFTGSVNAQSISRNGTTLRLRPLKGYYDGESGNAVQYTDANFIAANIVKGKSIFGLAGTAKGNYEATYASVAPQQTVSFTVPFTPSHVIVRITSQFFNGIIAFRLTDPVTGEIRRNEGASEGNPITVSGKTVMFQNARTDSVSYTNVKIFVFE